MYKENFLKTSFGHVDIKESFKSPILDILGQPEHFTVSMTSPISELLKQQAQITESFKSPLLDILGPQLVSMTSPISELLKQQTQITETFKSPLLDILGQRVVSMGSPISELLKQQTQITETFKSPLLELLGQQAQSIVSMKSPISEILKQQAQISESFKSPLLGLLGQQAEMITSYGGLTDIYKTLSKLDINEVIGAIEELEENSILQEHTTVLNQSPSKPPVYVHELTVEELGQLLEDKLNRGNEGEKVILKDFIKEILVSVGADGIKWLIKILLLPLLLHMYNYSIANHEMILNSIQQHAEEYLDIKMYVKNEGLSKYDYINLIGVTRVEAFLREGKSRNAPVVNSDKMKINSVVNILEKKGNWLKVQLTLEESCIEGWIEESKVERFKKASS